MPENEKALENARKTDEKRQVKNQNQQHNSKKAALGPNTKR